MIVSVPPTRALSQAMEKFSRRDPLEVALVQADERGTIDESPLHRVGDHGLFLPDLVFSLPARRGMHVAVVPPRPGWIGVRIDRADHPLCGTVAYAQADGTSAVTVWVPTPRVVGEGEDIPAPCRLGAVWFGTDRPPHAVITDVSSSEGKDTAAERPSLAYCDTELVKRAVRSATSTTARRLVEGCVADTFCIGSGVARVLCRRFGVDPDEMIGPGSEEENDGDG